MNYRVNAGRIPSSHWAQDAREGGGRIIGEVCHFIDFMHFMTGSLTTRVYAEPIASAASTVRSSPTIPRMSYWRKIVAGSFTDSPCVMR